jgi:hypothetical protein
VKYRWNRQVALRGEQRLERGWIYDGRPFGQAAVDRLNLRTMLAGVAMVAIAMVSIRLSVPEDTTLRGLIPILCFVLIGIWTAVLSERNSLVGGAAGGVVGALLNVTAQCLYYHYLPFAPAENVRDVPNVSYLGPETCFVIDSPAGLIMGTMLGSVVWVGEPPTHGQGAKLSQCARSTTFRPDRRALDRSWRKG